MQAEVHLVERWTVKRIPAGDVEESAVECALNVATRSSAPRCGATSRWRAFTATVNEVDLRAPGFGHRIPALSASKGKAQMCKGGFAQLAHVLVRPLGRVCAQRQGRRHRADHAITPGYPAHLVEHARWRPARRVSLAWPSGLQPAVRRQFAPRRQHYRTTWLQLRPGGHGRPRPPRTSPVIPGSSVRPRTQNASSLPRPE